MSILNSFVKSVGKLFKEKKKKRPQRKRLRRRPSENLSSRPKKTKKRKSPPKKTAKKKGKKKSTRKSTPKRSKPKKPSRFKKKKIARKPAKRARKKPRKAKSQKPSAKKVVQPKGVLVGKITHYFSRIEVVVIKVTQGKIHVGDSIHIKGNTTDFTQKIASLQIESVDVASVRKGQLAGLKVKKKAKEGDSVYRL